MLVKSVASPNGSMYLFFIDAILKTAYDDGNIQY